MNGVYVAHSLVNKSSCRGRYFFKESFGFGSFHLCVCDSVCLCEYDVILLYNLHTFST